MGPGVLAFSISNKIEQIGAICGFAAMLLSNADKQGNVGGQTQQQIAETLGVYRETVTNAIGEMKSDKVISVGRKRITVLDPDRLRKMAAI